MSSGVAENVLPAYSNWNLAKKRVVISFSISGLNIQSWFIGFALPVTGDTLILY